jgi:iron-sulfur cluster assembly protein
MMATARLRPQMMRLTAAAADRIKFVMANAGRPIVGVRVGVKNGGCASTGGVSDLKRNKA